jgi:hypothetical protein
MIQRKQSLFLFFIAVLGIALLFIPIGTIKTNSEDVNIYLVPLSHPELTSTAGHMTAIALNFVGLILAFTTIFLYRKRELQVKLCYVLMVLWLVIGLMMAFCPFVTKTETVISVQNNYFGPIIAILAVVAAFIATRFIKKDIELIKSADRIR